MSMAVTPASRLLCLVLGGGGEEAVSQHVFSAPQLSS